MNSVFRKINLSILAFMAIALTATIGNAQSVQPQPRKSPLEKVKEDYKAVLVNLETVDQRLGELNAARQEKQNQLDQTNVSESSFREIMRLLQTQRIEMLIDLAGLEARREAVENLSQPAQGQGDTVIPLLEQMIGSARDNLARYQQLYESGSIPINQMETQKQKLLELELRLAEAKQSLRKKPTESNAELTQIAITQAEKKARLDMIQKLLREFVDSRGTIETISKLDSELIFETKHRAALKKRQHDLEELRVSLEDGN